MTPERILALLDAVPFIPFSVHLNQYSVHIGDPDAAWLEDDGATLVVESVVRNEVYLESLTTAAITRLKVRVHAPDSSAPEADALPDESVPPPKKRVLFICTRNSARSQMAEAWLNHLGGEQMKAESAGFEPGALHPLAIVAMREAGIDISEQKTKSIFELYRSGALFAVTICVCDESAEKAPVFPGTTERLHWSVPDPLAGGDETDAGVLDRMRAARDGLRERIEEWLREPGRER